MADVIIKHSKHVLNINFYAVLRNAIPIKKIIVVNKL